MWIENMDLHTPIKQEYNDSEEIFDNIVKKEEDISEYGTDQQTDVNVETGSKSEKLKDIKQYSNVSFFGQKPYKCSKCNLSFDLKFFVKHKRVCTGESYQCNYCVQYFDTKRHMKRHQKTQCGDKYQCNLCAACFTTKGHLEDHQKTHTEDKTYQYRHCDKLFIQQSTLVQRKKIRTLQTPFKYQCSQCDKSFACQVSLDKHLFTHTHQKPYKCSSCKKLYSYKDNLEKHQRVTCSGNKLYHCDHCDNYFTSEISIKKHLKQCNKDFVQNSSLAQHTEVHAGENPYQCSHCNKAFKWKNYLDIHLRTHTGQKTYKCNDCENCFRHKRNLEQHMKLHVGEKPYQCSFCNKCFKVKSYLDSHLNTHIEYKHQCNQCEKCFSLKKCLKRHMKIHTEEKLYHSSINNNSNSVVKKLMDLSQERSNHHMFKQTEVNTEKVELQQDMRSYSNLKISNNLYEYSNNTSLAGRNDNLNNDEVSGVSNNRFSIKCEKEDIKVKEEPGNFLNQA